MGQMRAPLRLGLKRGGVGGHILGMSNKFDVAIVGGGLTGPLLAVALANEGLRVVVLDAQPADTRRSHDFDGRSYAISLASRRLLEALGLWQTLGDAAQPILDIKVSDGRAGSGASPLHVHFDHREIEEGPFGHMIEDRYLRRALMDAALAHDGITVRDSVRVTGWRAGAVETEGSGDVTASLIVAADGRKSTIADLARIRRLGWDYHQTSLVCAIAHAKPHNGIAHQFFTPAGPLAILPLPGDQSSIVWTESRARAGEIMAMDDAAYLDALRPVFGDFLGDIALVGGRYAYPLGLSLAAAMTGPRMALAGDAAHGIHPLAGQGFNLGVRDVGALAQVLVEARRRGEDIGASDVLDRYAQWRRFDTAMMAAATDGINRLFSNDNPLLRLGRDMGLGLVQSVPGLRRMAMREAAGLTGELPRLLAGQRI